MADIAVRREARRRRILENSENRLLKITGKATENPLNDKFNDGTNPTEPTLVNGFVLPESISTVKVINQTKDFEYEDKNSRLQKFKNIESNQQLQEYHISTDCNLYNEYNLKNIENASKEKRKNSDNPKLYSISALLNEQSNAKQVPQGIYLYKIFFSPVSIIILAVCLNILVLMNGIIIPYVMLIAMQLYLGKAQDIQGSGILIAALVLCNIKAEIVHFLKNLFTYLDMIVKNFALYITSFIFINWITTIFFYNCRKIQFF